MAGAAGASSFRAAEKVSIDCAPEAPPAASRAACRASFESARRKACRDRLIIYGRNSGYGGGQG